MSARALLPQRSRDILWVISLILLLGAAILPMMGTAKAGPSGSPAAARRRAFAPPTHLRQAVAHPEAKRGAGP